MSVFNVLNSTTHKSVPVIFEPPCISGKFVLLERSFSMRDDGQTGKTDIG
jgi:hypothetical protein